MIRYPFIYNQVLQIYRDMEQIRFPIEPDNIISRFSNCRIRTYQQFAQTNGCSIRDVILLCESKSGCTHYDVANNRYLILWNSDNADNNVSLFVRYIELAMFLEERDGRKPTSLGMWF